MTSRSAFDYAIPFDIMVGYWVGTANIYNRKGVYALSTKTHVAIYWKCRYTELSFREAAEEIYEFGGEAHEYLDPRQAERDEIETILGGTTLAMIRTLRSLQNDFNVDGPYCESEPNEFAFVTGAQTRPDNYQFHVHSRKTRHHVYNSHHFPGPNEWQIAGPIVGEDGKVGVAVVQNFRRISYDVPKAFICKLE